MEVEKEDTEELRQKYKVLSAELIKESWRIFRCMVVYPYLKHLSVESFNICKIQIL